MKVLELTNITMKYNNTTVLDVDSFSIDKGEHVALVGHNGSGKTTLLSIAALLLKPSSGRIEIMGKKVDSLNHSDRQRYVTLVAQEPYFFMGSLEKNLLLALTHKKVSTKQKREIIRDIADMFGLIDLLRRSPGTFSSGELKRSAIARALIMDAPLILLDEPFANIDSRSASILQNVIRNLSDQRSIVFTTHELSHAYRLADRTVTLHNGMISPWTPENLYKAESHVIADGTDLVLESGVKIYYPEKLEDCWIYMVSIDARQIIISPEPIESSAQNSFSGNIRRVESIGENLIALEINCDGSFNLKATITKRTMEQFKFTVGDKVWAHFKASAIHIAGIGGNNNFAGGTNT